MNLSSFVLRHMVYASGGPGKLVGVNGIEPVTPCLQIQGNFNRIVALVAFISLKVF